MAHAWTNRVGRRCPATRSSGAKLEGLTGLRALLLEEPEQFPRTVTEKLLAYALGRRLEYYDQPGCSDDRSRRRGTHYRWSSLIAGNREEPAVPDARNSREETTK